MAEFEHNLVVDTRAMAAAVARIEAALPDMSEALVEEFIALDEALERGDVAAYLIEDAIVEHSGKHTIVRLKPSPAFQRLLDKIGGSDV